MSGGVPKRVKISRTQKNTFCKSGGWGQQGLILCGGQRGKQGMCNYIKKRTNLKEVLVSFEEEVEETEEIGVSGEITVQGAFDTGVDGLYTYYAFKTVGNSLISFDFPTGTASNPLELEVFVVGGGGGGGGSAADAVNFFQSNGAGGGGGGGQVNITTLTYTTGITNIPITVGGGGNGATFPQNFFPLSPNSVANILGGNGGNSSIGTIISKGGEGGKSSMVSGSGGSATFQSGGNSSGYNDGVATYNGGTGYAASDAVAGGGAGTKVNGGDYDNGGTSGNPPTGSGAGDGGAGVNTTNTTEIDTAWSSILTAINLPAANGFGGGGGGGASDTGTALNAGTGSDGGANGAAAGTDGISGSNLTSSKTAAPDNSPINTQLTGLLTLNAVANRGGGGGGSVSYAQKPLIGPPNPPASFPYPNGNRENFTPVDTNTPSAVPAVEVGGKGGSGLVIFRFLTDATTDKTVTKTVTKKRGRCSDGLNK